MTRIRKISFALLVIAVLALAVLGAQWLGWLTSKPAREATRPAQEPGVVRYAPGALELSSIKVQVTEEFPVPLAEPLSGRITYDENVTTRVSSPVAGRVISLKAQPGDFLKAGTPLLSLDSPELAAAVSDLEKSIADERRKQASFERSRGLIDAGVIARRDFESAEADLLQARSETLRARRRLANLVPDPNGAAHGEYVLRARMSGVVVERQVNPGMEVRPDLPNPLFVITDPTHLWVLIDLPEKNLSKVMPGHPVAIEVEAWPGERFIGRIVKIGEVVDPATRRIQVRCAVANPARKLKPEMYARALLLADEDKRAVRLPNSALVTEGIYSFVFVQREAGVFERRPVILAVQDRDYAYVAEGLSAGQRVVVQGALLISADLQAGS